MVRVQRQNRSGEGAAEPIDYTGSYLQIAQTFSLATQYLIGCRALRKGNREVWTQRAHRDDLTVFEFGTAFGPVRLGGQMNLYECYT